MKMKLFINSIGYSFRLIYRSSKLMILPCFALSLISATLPLLSTYILKYVLDELTVASPDIALVIVYVGAYIVTLIMLQGLNSVNAILYDSIIKKADYLYDCDIAEKLAVLQMSVIDTSKGKDMIEDVRYAKIMAVYLTYRIVQCITLLYTFCVAFATLVTFNIWFSLLFLVLTVPGIILNSVFDRKSENLRRKTAPDSPCADKTVIP